MKQKKVSVRRTLAMFLCLVMMLSLLPVSAFAVEEPTTVTADEPVAELTAATVAAPTFMTTPGSVTPGTQVHFNEMSVTIWYSVRTDGTVPTAEEIKAEKKRAVNFWETSPIVVTEDCTVYAVQEVDGQLSEVVSAVYKVVPELTYGMKIGTGEMQTFDPSQQAINVSKHYIKIGTLTGATGYYYLASKVALNEVDGNKVKTDGVKLDPNVFAEISDKSGAVHLGNEGGAIFIYTVAEKGDGSFFAVDAKEYKVAPVSLVGIKMTPSTTGPVLVGEKVALYFDTLPAEYDKFNPVYTYTLDGTDAKTVTPEAGKANGEVTLATAGDHVIKFTVTSATLGEAYTQSKEVTIKAVADAADVTLSYNNGQTKTFPGALLSKVGEFMTTENIAEAVLTFNKDLTAEEFIAPLVVPAGKKLTVELNSKTLTSTVASSWDNSGVGFRLGGAGADLTIQGTGTVNTASPVVAMATNASASAESHAKVTLKGGTLKCTNTTAIKGATDMDITVNGAVIEAVEDNNAFYGGGNIHVVSGTIKNNTSALFEEFDKLTIDNCNATTGGYVLFNGSNPVVINGGEFHAVGAIADYASDFTINGGEFYSPKTTIEKAFFGYPLNLKFKKDNKLIYNSEKGCFELEAKAPVVTGNMVLTYGNKAQAFDGTDLGAVGTFMKENAITEATLKLNADIPEFGTSLVVPAGATFTLDLNGHNLTTANAYTNIQAENFGVNMTITDTSVGDKKGTITTVPDYMMSYAVQFGTAIYDQDASEMGSLTINGGVTLTDGVGAYYGNINMDDVTVNGNVWIQGDSRQNVPMATIKNSTVNSNHMWSPALQGSGAKITLDACNVTSASAPVVTSDQGAVVESGTYSTGGAQIIGSSAKITINGGTFTGTGGNDFAAAFADCKLKMADGKKMVYNSDHWELGAMTITDSGNLKVIPANGTETAYTKVVDAFAAANRAGGTIQLTGDSSLTGSAGLVLNHDIILDLNGYTLTLDPEAMCNNIGAGAIDVAQGGSLTIRDSSNDKTGKLDLNGCEFGITLSGSDADFALESGIIDAKKTSKPISRDYWEGGFASAYTGKFTVTGGKILADAGTAIVLSCGDGTTATAVVSGGEIISTGRGSGLKADAINVEIKGNAKIMTESGTAVIVIGHEKLPVSAAISASATISGSGTNVINAKDATVTLSDDASITNSGVGSVIRVTGGVLNVEGNVKLAATGNNLIFGGGNGVVNLNGGSYKLDTNTLLIEQPIGEYDTPLKKITYKADETYQGTEPNVGYYIIATDADQSGYRGLVKRQDVNQTNALGQKVGYQDFEELKSAIAAADNALTAEGSGDAAYTEESKTVVVNAKKLASYYLDKPESAQHDIDIVAKRLNAAVGGLQTAGSVDPTQLADGVYDVTVTAMKQGKNEASMSADALNPHAVLIINGATKELHVRYKPMNLMGLIGHLQKLWYYDGKTLDENNQLVRDPNGAQHRHLCEVTEYYTTPSDDLTPVYAQFDPTVDYANDATQYPGVFVIPLNYLSATDNRYVCTVKVDAMGETTQDVDIAVLWGTAKAKAESEGALTLSTNNVSLTAGAEQTVTATLVGAQTYDVTWKSGNEQVATVVDGKITAVAAGTTKIAVTAKPNGISDRDSLTRVITVNVTGEVKPVKYAVTVNGGTGSGNYAEGATVNLKANNPAEGKVFDKWTGEGLTFADATAAETTFVMPAKAVTVTATYKDEPKPDTGLADGKYTAMATMLHEYKDQPSMCDPLFDATANVEIKGEDAIIKLMLANPIPGFPDQGADGSVKNVKMTYAGKTYEAESDLSHKVKMTAKVDNDLFKLTKGEKYDAQIITFTVPKDALKEETLQVDAYVNVVMNSDQTFRLKLGELVAEGASKDYEGTAKVNQFGKYDVKAVVTVKDNKITNVAITGSNFGGTSADVNKGKLAKVTSAVKELWNGMSITDAEGIFKAIMKKNSPSDPIDAVSGATTSAKTARDAVMNALNLEYVDEIINVPEKVEPGVYEVEIGYYSDVVWHSLVENEKTKATLTVNADKTMVLDFETKSGTRKEPLYILGFNGIYPNNDKTKKLTKVGTKAVMGLSSNDYSDEFFAKGTKVVNHLIFPLQGGLSEVYATNCYLYVPAMNNLNGLESGVVFENGKFNVDCFAKIYWDSMKKIGDVEGADEKAAAEVDKLIAAIGRVDKNSGNKIEAARKAYNALTDDQKKLVKNLDVLEKAEKKFAELTKPETGDKQVGTVDSVMMHEYKEQKSMCDIMFDEKIDVEVNGDMATIKLYVANPVPGFPTLGKDGTVKNFVITYNGKQYKAESKLGSGATMTAKESHPTFKFEKDKEYAAQVLTVTLPKEAIKNGEKLVANTYVNVVMNTDVEFRIVLSNLKLEDAKDPDPDPDPEEKPNPDVKPDPEKPEVDVNFIDVPYNHWARNDIYYVVENGIFEGVSKNHFNPEGTMTRAMFVTVLGRMSGVNVEAYSNTKFDDVINGEWYAPYVAWGVEAGIVKGMTDKEFAPHQMVRRQDMAVFLARYCEYEQLHLENKCGKDFDDEARIDNYAKDAVEKITDAGLIKGMGDGTFSPKTSATRAQVATLLARFIREYSL